MQRLYGDIRTIEFNDTVDAIVEWWCLFHLPKGDHEHMIARFAKWLKPNGTLEFTSGDTEYEESDNSMLNQELHYYSLPLKFMNNILKNTALKFF